MKNAEEKNKLVYRVLAESLFPVQKDGVGEMKLPTSVELWRSVFYEMRIQTVNVLPDKWLDEHRVFDKELYDRWKLLNRDGQIRMIYIMFAQQRMLKLLADNGIKTVIIKGAAASVYYPDPFLRLMGDIDFLVKREDFERAAKLLESDGYTLKSDDHHKDGHHSGYVKNGICFELHRRLPIVDEHNERLLKLFEDGIDNAETARIDSFEFPILPKKLNGLVLLFHINQHIRVGLGLRQIIDWMLFVDRHIDDEVWKNEFGPTLTELKLDRFAAVVTEMCRMHLGLRKDITWCASADHAACDSLLEYVMKKGNFGVRSSEEEHISSVFMRSTNPGTLISRMQELGLAEWQAARKNALLRPFAWIRHGFKVAARMRKKHIPYRKIRKLRKEGVRQRRFIEYIGLEPDRILYDD